MSLAETNSPFNGDHAIQITIPVLDAAETPEEIGSAKRNAINMNTGIIFRHIELLYTLFEEGGLDKTQFCEPLGLLTTMGKALTDAAEIVEMSESSARARNEFEAIDQTGGKNHVN